MLEPTTQEQWNARQTWQYRCVEATRGNDSKLGAIVLAVIGKSRERRAFGANAVIDKDGRVLSLFTNKDGITAPVEVCRHVDELAKNISGLADYLKLNDGDRVALFTAVRSWISADERIVKEPLHFTKTGA